MYDGVLWYSNKKNTYNILIIYSLSFQSCTKRNSGPVPHGRTAQTSFNRTSCRSSRFRQPLRLFIRCSTQQTQQYNRRNRRKNERTSGRSGRRAGDGNTTRAGRVGTRAAADVAQTGAAFFTRTYRTTSTPTPTSGEVPVAPVDPVPQEEKKDNNEPIYEAVLPREDTTCVSPPPLPAPPTLPPETAVQSPPVPRHAPASVSLVIKIIIML